ncbi:shikimate dehydrogenase family protein [Bacteroidota bacterium]
MRIYGLIGYPLSHSLSRKYFLEKFIMEGIRDTDYRLFPLNKAAELNNLLEDFPDIIGLNVTTPFKNQIIPFLDNLDDIAHETGAVNTIKIFKQGNKLIKTGYNTDVIAFKTTLYQFIDEKNYAALILGTGGASRSVAKVLKDNNMKFCFVSKSKSGKNTFTYNELDKSVFQKFKLIINTTPLGTFPDIQYFPEIPYHYLTEDHFLYDLVYNPIETMFLANGKKFGAKTTNGLKMLKIQADKAWEIWNND